MKGVGLDLRDNHGAPQLYKASTSQVDQVDSQFCQGIVVSVSYCVILCNIVSCCGVDF